MYLGGKVGRIRSVGYFILLHTDIFYSGHRKIKIFIINARERKWVRLRESDWGVFQKLTASLILRHEIERRERESERSAAQVSHTQKNPFPCQKHLFFLLHLCFCNLNTPSSLKFPEQRKRTQVGFSFFFFIFSLPLVDIYVIHHFFFGIQWMHSRIIVKISFRISGFVWDWAEIFKFVHFLMGIDHHLHGLFWICFWEILLCNHGFFSTWFSLRMTYECCCFGCFPTFFWFHLLYDLAIYLANGIVSYKNPSRL